MVNRLESRFIIYKALSRTCVVFTKNLEVDSCIRFIAEYTEAQEEVEQLT